jgi:hypothetical protein
MPPSLVINSSNIRCSECHTVLRVLLLNSDTSRLHHPLSHNVLANLQRNRIKEHRLIESRGWRGK